MACTGIGLASAAETTNEKWSISPRSEITREKEKLTESDEGDEESKELHVGRVEIERRERKVVSLKAAAKRGETRLVRDPI